MDYMGSRRRRWSRCSLVRRLRRCARGWDRRNAQHGPILGSRVRARACRGRRAACAAGRSPGGAHARLRRGSRYSLRYRRGPSRDRAGKQAAGAVRRAARCRGSGFRFAGAFGVHRSRAIGVGSANPPDGLWPSRSVACGSTRIARSHLRALGPRPLDPSRCLRLEDGRPAHRPARWRLLILRSRLLRAQDASAVRPWESSPPQRPFEASENE